MQLRDFLGCVLVLLVVGGAPLRGDVIADSTEDWSTDGVQGENGWVYGYYNLTLDEEEGNGEYDAEDFIAFKNDGSFIVDPEDLNHWDGTQYRLYRDGEGEGAGLPNTGPWTRMGEGGNPNFGHPNGTNSGAPTEVDDPRQDEHWVIKRWVSDFSGTVNVTTSLTSQNTNCGNGTTTHLFHNGSLIDTIQSPNDPDPIEAEDTLTIAAGDFLDYALSPEGEDGGRGDSCDGSIFGFFVDSVSVAIPGDFDGDGTLGAGDIDDLTAKSAGGTNPPAYDLNKDALVNEGDVRVWVKDLFKSWIGDANLDRQFNSTDLVQVLAAGTYEVEVDSVWTTGDFNGDGRTNSSDLVAGLADGGYELGPVQAVQSVPEPSMATLLLSGLLGALAMRRRSTMSG
jgi:hypothetical protein